MYPYFNVGLVSTGKIAGIGDVIRGIAYQGAVGIALRPRRGLGLMILRYIHQGRLVLLRLRGEGVGGGRVAGGSIGGRLVSGAVAVVIGVGNGAHFHDGCAARPHRHRGRCPGSITIVAHLNSIDPQGIAAQGDTSAHRRDDIGGIAFQLGREVVNRQD